MPCAFKNSSREAQPSEQHISLVHRLRYSVSIRQRLWLIFIPCPTLQKSPAHSALWYSALHRNERPTRPTPAPPPSVIRFALRVYHRLRGSISSAASPRCSSLPPSTLSASLFPTGPARFCAMLCDPHQPRSLVSYIFLTSFLTFWLYSQPN